MTLLEQVKEYTHQKRAERHQKGNIKGRAAKLREQGVDLPVMDGVVPKGGPSGRPKMTRGTNNFERYNKEMDVLTANGFIRARMVRVRLLHYLVCRLVGAFHAMFTRLCSNHCACWKATSRLFRFDISSRMPCVDWL